jgi:Ca-activated chloride channel family protein
MNIRTTLGLATLGMALCSAGALAVPVSAPGGGRFAPPPEDPSLPAGLSHFSAGQTLTVDARLGQTTLARSSAGETFLFASVTGADNPAASAPPMNLAVVIDRSGSMKGERIANAMQAAVGIVDRMRDGDSVTVVAFDTTAQVIVPPSRATSSSRAPIEAAIRNIRLGADTCISCGLEEAMAQLTNAPVPLDHVNRMILLSDGEANHGIRDVSGLRAMAGRMRDRGCSITTMGVDVDFDEKVMAAIASESNGRHYFVQNATSLPGIFEQEFDSLLATVARDGELSVEVAPGVEVVEVFDRSFRREGNRIVVPFGTFSAKQEKTVLMKVRVPTDTEGAEPVAAVRLAFRDLLQKSDGRCEGELALRVTDAEHAQTELDPFVAARVARSETAETLTSANKLFEAGRIGEARSVLEKQEAVLHHAAAQASVAARSLPVPADARKSAGAFERDFAGQLDAVATAESNFARPPPPPVAGAAPARPVQSTREGKAATRQNQAAASDLSF